MRDPAILCLICGLSSAAFIQPWIGVLALTVIGYMHPQGYAWGNMKDFPAYKVALACLFTSLLFSPQLRLLSFWKQRLRMLHDWRVVVLFLLWCDFFITSVFALNPSIAWPKFIEISKVVLSLIFTLLLIDTRKKLFCLVVTIALSVALLATKGGVWALVTGSMDRVYGPPGSHFYGNNEFAILTIMNIPLLVLWLRTAMDRRLIFLIWVFIALSIISALTSWSRGGLLSLLGVAVFLIGHSRRKQLVFLFFLLVFLFSIVSFPLGWFERMQTIVNFHEEGSAMGRLEIWKEGVDFAFKRPWVGAGLDGWVSVVSRDWHSAYIELLAENGFPGLILWIVLLFGTIISLSRLGSLAHEKQETLWMSDFSRMLQASLIAYAIGAAFLGLAYWDILYHLILISVLLSAYKNLEINLFCSEISNKPSNQH